MTTYHIWYKDFRSKEFKIARTFGSAALENKLLDLSILQKSVYLILKNGKVMDGQTGDQMMDISF